jgi:DNA-binding transcriptional regulator YiaG
MTLSKTVLSMMKDATPEEIKATEDLVKMKLIGIELTKIRHNLGVSTEVFANMLGISEEHLEDLELGDINKEELQTIQEIFGVYLKR